MYARIFLCCSHLRYWYFFWSTNCSVMKLLQIFLTVASPFLPKTFSPCLIMYWFSIVSFVMMLVGVLGSTKVDISFNMLTVALVTLCRAWDPTIRLLQTMEILLDIISLYLMVGGFCGWYPFLSGGRISFSTPSFSVSAPSFYLPSF